MNTSRPAFVVKARLVSKSVLLCWLVKEWECFEILMRVYVMARAAYKVAIATIVVVVVVVATAVATR